MLAAILSRGAPSPVGGINSAAIQQANENPITNAAKPAISPPPRAARPPTMVPVRIATKVAPSTSALPAGNSARGRWSGRMPYLIGPNKAAITPKPASAQNSTATDCCAKPITARPGDKNFKKFQPLRHPRLVVAVGQFAAERRQEEIRRDKNGARQRDQRLRAGAPAEQDQKDQRGFEKIIVECREKLAPEQRRKAPRQHQRERHCPSMAKSRPRRCLTGKKNGRPGGRPR